MRTENISKVITKLNKEGFKKFVNKECIVNNKKRIFERSSLK